MARCANDVGLCVITAPYIRPVLVFGMAPQTGIEGLPRSHLGERANRVLPAFSLHVFLTRTMATFATGLIDWRVRKDSGLVVGVSKKLKRHIRVAGTTCIAAGIGIVGRGRFRSCGLGRHVVDTQHSEQQKTQGDGAEKKHERTSLLYEAENGHWCEILLTSRGTARRGPEAGRGSH